MDRLLKQNRKPKGTQAANQQQETKRSACCAIVFLAAVGTGACGEREKGSPNRVSVQPPAGKPVPAGTAEGARPTDPDDIIRIDPDTAHKWVTAGKALLVCAYESDLAFKAARLEGAMRIQAFEAMAPKLDRNQEIIFYCS